MSRPTGANLGADKPANHAKGCCCFRCDPGGERTKRALERARDRAAQAKRFTETTGIAPKKPRPAPPPYQPTNRDRKFRALLASGIGHAAAIAQMDAEERGDRHDDRE